MRAFRVGLGGIRLCSDARWDMGACVRFFELFLPRRGPCLDESTVFSLAAHASRPRVRTEHVPAKIGEFMRYAASAPSHWMARVLLAVRTSSRMREIK